MKTDMIPLPMTNCADCSLNKVNSVKHNLLFYYSLNG